MARSAMQRDKKYRRKFDIEHTAKQLSLAKDEMVAQYAQTQAELQQLEDKARVMLGENDVPTIFYPSYLNFARQVWRLHKNFTGGTMEVEVKVILDKWVARKLDKKILEQLRFELFAVKEPD